MNISPLIEVFLQTLELDHIMEINDFNLKLAKIWLVRCTKKRDFRHRMNTQETTKFIWKFLECVDISLFVVFQNEASF